MGGVGIKDEPYQTTLVGLQKHIEKLEERNLQLEYALARCREERHAEWRQRDEIHAHQLQHLEALNKALTDLILDQQAVNPPPIIVKVDNEK